MENALLAPAAGSGIGKMLADSLLATPGFVQLLTDVAVRGLNATTPPRWDKESESWTDAPDFRVQIQTLALLLSHMEGEPIKRVIHQHLGGDGGKADPLAALQDSPALRAAVERTLEKAKWKESGRSGKGKNAKQAEVVLEVD